MSPEYVEIVLSMVSLLILSMSAPFKEAQAGPKEVYQAGQSRFNLYGIKSIKEHDDRSQQWCDLPNSRLSGPST